MKPASSQQSKIPEGHRSLVVQNQEMHNSKIGKLVIKILGSLCLPIVLDVKDIAMGVGGWIQQKFPGPSHPHMAVYMEEIECHDEMH